MSFHVETARGKAILEVDRVPYEVSAYMVHEIRNALMGCMGLDLIKRRDGSDHDACIDMALANVKRIEAVLTDLFPNYIPKNKGE